jgi:hypothetical protein
MTKRRDAIDEARHAAEPLIGSHGIVGVGRTRDAVVFFVENRDSAAGALERWSSQHPVPIDIEGVERFLPASRSASPTDSRGLT